ncbi:nuclear pore complex associated protein [Schizosaccharomyces cryophilus OY26]|uniref:Nuclear pore complex associated protein n=1 Tax=Schizosaccharomyces cryophilus (strain OY26 / ATCC MYA-4695 / CBS 11777 / NBRC 106824 / NRRL Y48691) TaxID=653667 RepID=S9VRM2_SCHCR|nr:nuclear pore complex associated protein [Schizosaccharomyces cryophilus OY26]EPY50583.1 nuclear pore complex associated protein [Schizosaccharomyces cryophilus OY26]
MIGRRPQGLRAAASLKKQQLEKQRQEAAANGSASSEQGNGDVNKVEGDEDETMLVYTEDDNIDQLWGLYEMSREKLESGDIEGSISLVFGTIHEADRILRNTEDYSGLPKDFHAAYSMALLAISELYEPAKGRLKETNDEESFIDAAIERAQLGLEAPGDHCRLYLAFGRAYLEKVRISLWKQDDQQKPSDPSVIIQIVNPYIELALNYLRPLVSVDPFDDLTPDSLRPLYVLSSYMFQFGFQYSESLLLDVHSLIINLWEKCSSYPDCPIPVRLATKEAVLASHTSFAEYYIDLMETDEQNADKWSSKASEWLSRSADAWSEIYSLDNSAERLLKLADIKMDLAQITDQEESQDNYLKAAFTALQDAQKAGVELNPDYLEFVEAYSSA